jgi:hypothetical protein
MENLLLRARAPPLGAGETRRVDVSNVAQKKARFVCNSLTIQP